MSRVLMVDNQEVVVIDWSISDRINSRSTLDCTITDLKNLTSINEGDEIKLINNGKTIFNGIVWTVEDYEEMPGHLYYNITAVDNNAKADKRVIAKVYENTLAGDIVKDLITEKLTYEGIIEGNIADGPIIEKAVFNYIKCSEALDYIKDVTGYNWNIDVDNKLHFFDRSQNIAPFTLDDTIQHKDFRRKRTLDRYRNKQYVRAGKGKTATQTDEKPTPKPDGVSKKFIVRYPIAEKPTIKINNVVINDSDVGVNGLDQDKKYYFSYGSNVITQEQTEPTLQDTDVIEITYKGLYPILTLVDNPEEIQNRKEKETGTSGIYEHLTKETSINDNQQAIQYGQGLVQKYGNIQDVVTFSTNVEGLQAGQLLPINKELYGIRDDFLIESININPDGPEDIEYSVTCLDGAAIGGWEEFFKELLKGQREFVIQENEVIILLNTQTEKQSYEGELKIKVFDSLYPSDTLYPSDILYPNGNVKEEVTLND